MNTDLTSNVSTSKQTPCNHSSCNAILFQMSSNVPSIEVKTASIFVCAVAPCYEMASQPQSQDAVCKRAYALMHSLAGMHPFSYPFRSELRSLPHWLARTAWSSAEWVAMAGDNSLSPSIEPACCRWGFFKYRCMLQPGLDATV